MSDMEIADLPRLGAHASVQVPGGHLQLAKIVENRLCEQTGIWHTLVCWVNIRRDAEWIPSRFVPPTNDIRSRP
jgi:hypothetical protein